ncbi:MAG: Ig-like domain-containing protein, partial [Deltaproteobacteria bacterium]|nr:Ig-like domain-containing protein [Deltaproteobacteria bacterium]
MGITWTRKYRVFKGELGLLITGFALFLVLNGCGSAGVAPGSGGGTTETATTDATLIVPVDSSVSASLSKSVSFKSSKDISADSPFFNVGKGVLLALNAVSGLPRGIVPARSESGIVLSKAVGDDSSSDNFCNCYDGSNGTLLNPKPASIVGSQAKLLIDSSKLSSATTTPLVECKVNNSTLPIALPQSVAAALKNISTSDLKEVTSPLSFGPASYLAFQQMLVGSGKSDTLGTISGTRTIPADVMKMNSLDIYNDMTKIRADTSNALAKSYDAQIKAMKNMMAGGGGIDIAATMKNVVGGNAAALAQYGNFSSSEAADFATLAVKDAQYFIPAMTDATFNASFQTNAAVQTQMQEIRKSTATSGVAAFTKMASGMTENPAAMFKLMNDSSFTTMPPAAVMQVTHQAVDNKMFANTAGMGQFETLYKSTAMSASNGTLTSAMTASQMEKLIKATGSYITTNNLASATAENITSAYSAFDTFKKDDNAGRLDPALFNALYFTTVQTTIQTQVLAFTDFTKFSTMSADFFTQMIQTTTTTLTNFYTDSWESTGGSTAIYSGGDLTLSFSPIDTEPLVAVANLRPQVTIIGSLDFNSVLAQNMTLVCGGQSVAGSPLWDSASKVWKFVPSVSLTKNVSCTFSVSLNNLSGQTFARSITFTTERDNFACSFSSPASGATNVSTNTNFSGSCNYNIDSATGSNISLVCGGSSIAGSVAITNANFTFNPAADIAPSTNCTATIGTNLKDIYGRFSTLVERSITTGLGSDVTNPGTSAAEATLSSTSSAVTISVAGVTDDVTAADQILCDAYHSAASGGQSFGSASATSNAGGAGAVVSSLNPDTLYYFVIRCRDATGNFSQLAEISKKTAPPLPGFPWASWDSNNSRVSIGSLKATGAVSFNVYRGITNCDNASYIGNVVAPNADAWNTYYDNIGSPIPWGTVYCYKVTSVGEGGEESERSSAMNVTISLAFPQLSFDSNTASSIDVSWAAVTGAASYKLYRSLIASNCSDQNLVYQGANTSFSDTGLSADTNHYYCAYAVTSGGLDGGQGTNSKWTNPAAPDPLNCSAASSTSATCSWTLPNNFYYLILQRSTNGGASWSNQYTRYYNQSGTTSYTNTGLTTGATYNYRLQWQTSTAYQYSDYSEVSNVTTEVGTATGVSATARGPKRVSLKWDATSGATSYEVYRKASSGVTASDTLAGTVTGLVINDAGLGTGGLTAGTAYYYKVRPIANGVAGTLSSEVSATPTLKPMAEGGGHPSYRIMTAFLKSDGTVWTTGGNTRGQLGDNTTTVRNSPVQVVNTAADGYLTGIVKVDVSISPSGDSSVIALKNDGTVWTWGDNGDCCAQQYKLLGNNESVGYRKTPSQVAGLSGMIDVAAGNGHMLALKNDGTVWSWGYLYEGGLGNGSSGSSATPVQASSLADAVAIAAGYQTSYALSKDGSVRWWGKLSSTTNLTPTLLSGSAGKMVQITASYQTLLALGKDGDIYGLGSNWVGPYGNNSTSATWSSFSTSYRTREPATCASSSTAWTDVQDIVISPQTGNDYLTVFALKGGSVFSWGVSYNGALGDGTGTDRKCAVQIPNLSGINIIGAGGYAGFAIDGSGNVKGWGLNK